MGFETELETYRKKLPELKQQEGKYILIRGSEVIDTFDSYEDAIKEGYKQFGLEPFFVKQIHAIEKIQFISRFVIPQCEIATG